MEEVDKKLNEVVDLIGPELDYDVPKSVYDFLRRYGPMFCVDLVIIPEDKPSTLLLMRNNSSVVPNNYYFVGGRVNKQGNIIEIIKDKLVKELNLKVNIEMKDILGFGFPSFFPNSEEEVKRDYTVFTPAICFVCKLNSFDKVKDSIEAGDGNDSWKTFYEIDPNWDQYLKNAIAFAWDRHFGKEWRENLDKEIKENLDDFSSFIPLKFDVK
jgi:hypothetical protein